MNPNHRRCSFKGLFNSGPDRQAVLNVKPLCQSRIELCMALLYQPCLQVADARAAVHATSAKACSLAACQKIPNASTPQYLARLHSFYEFCILLGVPLSQCGSKVERQRPAQQNQGCCVTAGPAWRNPLPWLLWLLGFVTAILTGTTTQRAWPDNCKSTTSYLEGGQSSVTPLGEASPVLHPTPVECQQVL